MYLIFPPPHRLFHLVTYLMPLAGRNVNFTYRTHAAVLIITYRWKTGVIDTLKGCKYTKHGWHLLFLPTAASFSWMSNNGSKSNIGGWGRLWLLEPGRWTCKTEWWHVLSYCFITINTNNSLKMHAKTDWVVCLFVCLFIIVVLVVGIKTFFFKDVQKPSGLFCF